MEIQQPPSRHPVVLVFAPHYWPAFRAGGAVRTLRNMAAQLGDAIDFRIFTRDRDVGDKAPYAGIEPGRWDDVDGVRVMYAGDRQRGVSGIARMIRDVDPDVVYLNSFFDPNFSLQPLMARRFGMTGRNVPWVIAPRGEFSKGAIALKPWKKRPYSAFCRVLSLHNGVIWQASSDLEREDIRRVMGTGSRIRIAADLTEQVGPLPGVQPERTGPMRVCFLSRLSPKKNLLYAIDVIRRVRQPICFDILGPREDLAYWETCQRAIAQAPAGCTIEWKGEVPHEDVRKTLARYDLMLFPTLGENFGHVIFEALAAGVPVLVSDQTPWQDLDARGSGWVRPLADPQAFVAVLESAAGRDAAARRAAAVAAHAHALEVSRSAAVLGANRGLFLDAALDAAPAG
jgi:glycosyltransferase involved in cell wall biosynthesis